MRWSTAAGVGVVVVLAAAIMIAAYVLLASAGVIGNTYTVQADFPDAQGVTKGTEVRLAGVKIGEVDQVLLTPSHRALFKMRILQRYPIPPRSTFQIASTGLLTAPIVQVVPAEQGPPVQGAFHGTAAPTIDQLMPQAQQLLTNLNGLTRSLQGIVGNRELVSNLQRSTANIADVSERGKAIAANLQAASVSGRQVAAGFQQTAGRLNRTAAMLQQTVAGNRGKIGQTLTALNDTMGAMHGLVDQLTVLVSDPKLKSGLTGTVANLDQATANLNKMSANLEKLSGDPQLNEDLRATVHETRATMEQTQQLVGRLNRLLGGGRRGAARAQQGVRRSTVTVDLAEQTRPGRLRLDLNAFVPAGADRFYRVGLYDLSESNKLNLQLGQPLLGNTVRYGMYASRLGIGFDVGAPTHPHFSADLYSLADPQLDLRARAGIRPGLDLFLGVRSALHRNVPTVGVTWRR